MKKTISSLLFLYTKTLYFFGSESCYEKAKSEKIIEFIKKIEKRQILYGVAKVRL